MKNLLAKFFPLVAGVCIGWLFFHPPAFLAPLGAFRFVIMVALGIVLLVVIIAATISANLPEDIQLSPAPQTLPADMQTIIDRAVRLGFQPAGGPFKVGMTPPAILMPLVHESEGVYASVYRTGTIPAVTNYDFVSILDGFRGGLTTNPDPRGGTLPSGPKGLRQIFPGCNVEQLFKYHCEGVAYLRSRGLPCKAVTPESFVSDFKRAMAMQREGFRKSPLRYAVIALWRTISKQVPHKGALRMQPYAEQQIRALITGM